MKTHLLKFAMLAAIFLMLPGSFVFCKKEKGQKIPFIEIAKGVLSGGQGIPEQDLIITSQEEWENLKAVMGNAVKYFLETEIDFDKYQVVAVFDELRYSGGWDIFITKITDFSEKIMVTVTARPDGGGIVPEVVTRPYHIVKMPATTKKIEFNHIKK